MNPHLSAPGNMSATLALTMLSRPLPALPPVAPAADVHFNRIQPFIPALPEPAENPRRKGRNSARKITPLVLLLEEYMAQSFEVTVQGD